MSCALVVGILESQDIRVMKLWDSQNVQQLVPVGHLFIMIYRKLVLNDVFCEHHILITNCQVVEYFVTEEE